MAKKKPKRFKEKLTEDELEAERAGELPDRERAPAQPLEDLTSGRISKRLQCPLLVSVHEQSIYTYR